MNARVDHVLQNNDGNSHEQARKQGDQNVELTIGAARLSGNLGLANHVDGLNVHDVLGNAVKGVHQLAGNSSSASRALPGNADGDDARGGGAFNADFIVGEILKAKLLGNLVLNLRAFGQG